MRPLADIVYAACSNPDKLILSHPTPQGRRAIGAALKAQMFGSRRFYVDEEVTRAATKLGVQHPDILMSMLQRARLPFEKVWVEWDNHAQTTEAGGILADDAQKRVGCLIEKLQGDEPLYKLTVIGQPTEDGEKSNRIVVSPLSIVYHLSKPLISAHTQGDQKKIAEISNLPAEYVRKTLIGGAYMEKGLTSTTPVEIIEEIEHRRNLCDNLSNYATWVFSSHMVPIVKSIESGSRIYNKNELSKIIKNEVIEESGTWRFIVSLFALINARDYVDSEISHRQGHNRMVSGKIVPYLDHWLVRLKLPRKIVHTRLVREFAEAIPRRRHEVIGHWKQNSKGLPDCEHIYVDETPKRQVCIAENCGHKRWWVNNFMRGDASIGIIIKDRLVTK